MAGIGQELNPSRSPSEESSAAGSTDTSEQPPASGTYYCMGEEVKVPLMKPKMMMRSSFKAHFLGFDECGYGLIRPMVSPLEVEEFNEGFLNDMNNYYMFCRDERLRNMKVLEHIQQHDVFVFAKNEKHFSRVEYIEYNEKKGFVAVRNLDTGKVFQGSFFQLFIPKSDIFSREPFRILKCKVSGLEKWLGSETLKTVYTTLVGDNGVFNFKLPCKVTMEEYSQYPLAKVKALSNGQALSSEMKKQFRHLRQKKEKAVNSRIQ